MVSDCAVCYVADINFMLPALISATRFRRFVSPSLADIYIFALDAESDKLKEINAFLAAQSIKGVEVIRMESRYFTGIDWARANKTHVPISALGRFFMADLLPETCRKVVYLDGDTWIKRNPSSLIEAAIPEGRLAAVEDVAFFCRNDITAHGRFVRSYFRGLGLDGRNGYFNSGVLATTKNSWRILAAEAIHFFRNNIEACKYHDQSALNAVVGDRRLRLSPVWNFQTPYRYWNSEDEVDPAIYHFTQGPKPWMGAVEPWRELFPIYQQELAAFAALRLPVRQLTEGELAQTNAASRRLKRKMKWLYPVRMWIRHRNFKDMARRSISLNGDNQ